MNKFEQQLNETPDDWSLRLIYSDYLEEIGDFTLSNAQCWMANNKRHSLYIKNKWVWTSFTTTERISNISRDIFGALKEGKDKWSYVIFFSSREDAERSLANALSKD